MRTITRFLSPLLGILLLSALGCPAARTDEAAGPTAVVPATTPVPPGPDPRALWEGFTPAHAWRAVLAHVGSWKLAPDEEWREAEEGADSWVPFDVLVADQAGDDIRVVAERDDLLYAVWIRRADLARVPVEPVALGSAPGRAPDEDEPGVRLAGGAPVEVLEQQSGWTHVRTQAAELQADGWVPDVLLAPIYRESDFVVVDERIDLEPAAGLEVCDGPNGHVLAVLRPDAATRMRVQALGEPQGGWREIRYPSALYLVHGWVKAEGLTAASPETPAGSTHTVSGYDARGQFNWLQISVATEVSDGPDGDVFAVTTMGTKLVVGPEHAPKRTAVLVHTIWGDIPGWVRCEPIPEGMSQPLIDTCVPPFEE